MWVTVDHIASPQQSTPGVFRERCLLATLGDGLRATSEATSVSWKLWRSSTLRRGDWSFLRIWLCPRDHSYAQYIYSWVNLVVPKNWAAYFSAISGQKFDLATVLRSCWPIEWRRRGFIASGPFFSLFLTFAHEKNHFPVVKSGFWGHISH